MKPDWLEELDHTADAGVVVSAATLERLFERAALALFRLVVSPASVRQRRVQTVRVEASDREALMVRWLSELNFLQQTEHLAFGQVEVLALSDHQLLAEAWGEPIDPARHAIRTEVKAVTYHGLRIWLEGGLWRAQVIFDL
jgi:SHS2 domain-containing protein